MNKKVIFYSPLLITGGMENAMYNLIRMLLETESYDITVLYKQDAPESENIFKAFKDLCVPVRCVKNSGERIRIGASYAPQKEVTYECDTLINCSTWDFDLPFIKAKRTINWFHGIHLANQDKLSKDTPKVVQSKWQSEQLFKNAGLEMEYDILPNIMDERRIRQLSQPKAVLPPIYGSDFLVVARLSPEKGWDKLIEFMRREENKDKVCTVIGGAYRCNNTQFIERKVIKALGKQVRFLGEIANPYPYMARAKYVLVFSDFETYGIVSKEAHILGKPVVFNRFATAEDQFIPNFDMWIDEFKDAPSRPLEYRDTEKMRVFARWEELINGD